MGFSPLRSTTATYNLSTNGAGVYLGATAALSFMLGATVSGIYFSRKLKREMLKMAAQTGQPETHIADKAEPKRRLFRSFGKKPLMIAAALGLGLGSYCLLRPSK